MLKDEIIKNREKMKEKGMRARIGYFFYYHWKILLIFTIIICCAIAYLHHFIESQKEPFIWVSMVDSNLLNENETNLVTDFAVSMQADTKVNPIHLEVDYQIGNASQNLYVAYSEKLSAYLELGKIDVLVAPEWVIGSCASQAYLGNIEEILPNDLYAGVKDRLVYHTYEADGRVPIAIYVGDIPKIKELFDEENAPYLAIGNLSSRKDTAVDFLRYLTAD